MTQAPKDIKSVHGHNPQFLIDKIVRQRCYDSRYWKEECFALTAETVIEKAVELKYIGGVYGGNINVTPFLCLLLKLLQLQPSKAIVVEYVQSEEFKYLRALGATYLRLVATSQEIYELLEPLYKDFRKLKLLSRAGQMEITHMDELIDELLREERVFDISLPRLQSRPVMEQTGQLPPRTSALQDELDAEVEKETKLAEEAEKQAKLEEAKVRGSELEGKDDSRTSRRSRSRSVSRERRRHRSSSRSPRSRKHRRRSRSRSPRRRRSRSRSRSRSPRRRRSRSPRHRSGRSPRTKRYVTDNSPAPVRVEEDESSNMFDVEDTRQQRTAASSGHKLKFKGDKKSKKKKKKEKEVSDVDKEKQEIEEANALRAKLGLKPLKV